MPSPRGLYSVSTQNGAYHLSILMPRTCTICNHEERTDIDKALVDGESFRNITRRFGTKKKITISALKRHKDAHLPKKLTKAKQADTIIQSNNLLDQIQGYLDKTDAIFTTVSQGKKPDLKTALLALKEVRGYLELLARARGELEPEGMIKIQVVVERENFLIQILMEAIRAEADPDTTGGSSSTSNDDAPASLPSLAEQLGQLVKSFKLEQPVVDIITFAEDPNYLNRKLYPAQKEILQEFFDPNKNYEELLLICGRDSTKTFMASIIACYVAYLWLMIPDPYYLYQGRVDRGKEVHILCIATKEEQATILLDEIKAKINSSPFFQSRKVSENNYEIVLQKNLHILAVTSNTRVRSR